MNYEIVELAPKAVVGITARTDNSDPNMPQTIGALWQQFFNGTYQSIQNKKNTKSIGLYTNYENKENAAYDVTVCCEVSDPQKTPDGLTVKTISAGKYAKFVVRGHMYKAVADFWMELWKMPLDRKYSFDFEEYQNDDMENAEIHIYIALN